ncbi:protein ALP1-like [Rutidosis leptorrhynchoides]|uniref:protein ALP1-like n=1 Tax=Rutidosis leptorrhynchoides TaxID=125765 RepID=UPI003A99DB72
MAVDAAGSVDFNKLALDYLDMEDAKEEEEMVEPIPRAPRRFLQRDREGTGMRLWNDYFSDNPTFPGDYFRKRYRMSRPLFIRICQGIINYSQEPIPDYFSYFHQRRDATGLLGFNIFQKCTSAIRQLAYGTAPDAFDEYLHMGQQTSYDCLNNFCKAVFHLYAFEYLIKPTPQDVQRLASKHAERHGFSGMLGSLDCMHWAWKNCPYRYKGHYTRGDHGYPTIMLEAVASYDLWIWHAYFGPAGSNNDINVLNQSDLFNDLLQDTSPPSDGIYPEWSTIVKSFKSPPTPETAKFKKYHESARKDIERAFGVLQGRWAIIKNPCRQFYVERIRRIMHSCVILHNMITEDNGRAMCALEENYRPVRRPRRSFQERVEAHIRANKELRDSTVHHLLRQKLIEHIWSLPANFRVRNNPQVGTSGTNANDDDEDDDYEDEDEEETEDEGDEENEGEDEECDDDDE